MLEVDRCGRVGWLPLAVGSFVASGLSFGLKLSSLTLVRIGLTLEALALAALGVVAATTSAPWWSIALTLFGYGIGVGFATAQVTNVVLADVPDEQAGQGSGIQSTFRQLGSPTAPERSSHRSQRTRPQQR